MSLDMTTFAFALKQYYTDDAIRNMVYKNNPFFAMVPKMTEFYGDTLPIPVIYSVPQGRSQDFASALANVGNTKGIKFLLTRKQNYSVARIGNEALEASENNRGAFISATITEINGAIHSLTRSLAINLYGNGGGAIGQISATGFTNTNTYCYLTDLEQVTNFEVGMVVNVSSADGTTGAIRTGTLTVAAVDRDLGKITFSVGMSSGISAIASSDYIFVNGDFGAALTGLNGWLPATKPAVGGGDAFFSVDRSVDGRLSGVIVDGSSLSIEEALIKGAARAGREGGAPDHCFFNFLSYENLEKSLGSKVQYIENKVGEVAFAGMRINGPRGVIAVYPDQNCPSSLAFMLQMDLWKLYSLKEPVRIFESDGNKLLRTYNADSLELRAVSYSNLGCQGPGWNARIKLA
jgi:hypothetical protein